MTDKDEANSTTIEYMYIIHVCITNHNRGLHGNYIASFVWKPYLVAKYYLFNSIYIHFGAGLCYHAWL